VNSVTIDKQRNRLTITLAAADRETLKDVVAEIKTAAREMEPDLTCLTDLRKGWPLPPGNGDLLKAAEQCLQKVGVGKVVRVLNPEQFNTPAYKRLNAVATSYRYSYATSVEEGEQILENFRQERLRWARAARRGKTLFKYAAPSGWEQDTTATDFYQALKELKRLRKEGRKSAIIVDAGFKQRG
jgi:hypothetical protein